MNNNNKIKFIIIGIIGVISIVIFYFLYYEIKSAMQMMNESYNQIISSLP